MNTHSVFVNGRRVRNDFTFKARKGFNVAAEMTVKISSSQFKALGITELMELHVDEYRQGRLTAKYEFNKAAEVGRLREVQGDMEILVISQGSEIVH